MIFTEIFIIAITLLVSIQILKLACNSFEGAYSARQRALTVELLIIIKL